MDGAAGNLGVRRDSLTSLTSHNKHTFQRFIGSFRTAVSSRDDAADTLSGELISAAYFYVFLRHFQSFPHIMLPGLMCFSLEEYFPRTCESFGAPMLWMRGTITYPMI